MFLLACAVFGQEPAKSGQLTEFDAQIAAHERCIADLDKEIDSLAGQKKKLLEQIAEKDSQIAVLEGKPVAAKQPELETLKKKDQELEQKKKDELKKLAEAKKEKEKELQKQKELKAKEDQKKKDELKKQQELKAKDAQKKKDELKKQELQKKNDELKEQIELKKQEVQKQRAGRAGYFKVQQFCLQNHTAIYSCACIFFAAGYRYQS